MRHQEVRLSSVQDMSPGAQWTRSCATWVPFSEGLVLLTEGLHLSAPSESPLTQGNSTAYVQWLLMQEYKGMSILMQLMTTQKDFSSSHGAGQEYFGKLIVAWIFPLSCFLPSLPQCGCHGQSLINILYATLHLRVCFPGNSICGKEGECISTWGQV